MICNLRANSVIRGKLQISLKDENLYVILNANAKRMKDQQLAINKYYDLNYYL